ncbi:MAG: methyltransferase domain-containing protein [Nanoarchaeota archaeon]
MDNLEKWNKVYKNRPPTELPWYGVPFLEHIRPFLDTLKKSELIILVGCGVGDTVDKLHKEGFTNIIGTDISSEAIEKAKKRFPHLSFKYIGTEQLSKENYREANVIDWLNFHQIQPELIAAYLGSLAKISKSLYIAYFYDPQHPYSRSSMVTGDLVYNYEPQQVANLLKGIEKTQESVFYVEPKKVVGRLGDKLRAVAQIYRKKK